MHKIGLSEELAFFGIVAAIVLLVLDKMGKLKDPTTLIILLAIAAVFTLPLALGNSFVYNASSVPTKFGRGMLMVCIVGVCYSLLVMWIFTPTQDENQQPPPQQKHVNNSSKEPKQPTVEEIATKHPPSVSNAKRDTHINSLDQFNPDFGDKLKAVSPFLGYFELSAGPSPSNPYSSLMVKTKEKFGTHYYASIRMGALENVNTMDFIGDICVCVLPGWNEFFIWESEQLQEGWYPIKIKSEKHPVINTLGVYQKGRNVSIYVNGELVREFVKIKEPSPCPIGVHLKANPQTGGKMHFQSFAVWEF